MKGESDSRVVNSSKTASMAFVRKIASLLFSFISRKVFIVYIGVEYLGISSLFSSILTLLAMADLGIGIALNYTYYKPLAEKDYEKVAALTNFYKKIYKYIALVIACLGIAILPFLKLIVNTENEISYLYVYYLLVLAETVISYLYAYKGAVINADQKGYLIHKYSLIIEAIKLVAQIIVIVLFRNYIVYLIVGIASTLANNLYISYKAKRLYPFLQSDAKLEKKDQHEITSNIKSVFVYKMAINLQNSVDSIIISILVGTVTVGLYSNYTSISSNLINITYLIFSSTTASLGNYVVLKSKSESYKTFDDFQVLAYCAGTIFATCFFVLIQDFIKIWLGTDYILSYPTVIAITLQLYLTIVLRPVTTFRDATGLYSKLKYIMLLMSCCNIILSLVLGYFLGLCGILLATSLSTLLTYFWYEPIILFKDFFDAQPKKYFVGQLKNFVLTVLIVSTLFLITSRWNGNIYLMWLLKAMVCLISSSLICLIRFRNSHIYLRIKEKVGH